MTSPNLLLPLRIPELGPSFGKLITGTGTGPRRVPLDDLRYQVVTEIIERCGEARRLVSNDERDAAISILGREEWLSVWEHAVTQVGERVIDRIAQHLEAEAVAVSMPAGSRRQVVLDPSERRAMMARIGSAGADLIPALDAIGRWSEPARTATALQRDEMEHWQDAQRSAARRLETAWLAMEDAVEQEITSWLVVADRISKWRRPQWPVYVAGAVVTTVAVWIGLLSGGVLPAPRWIEPLLQAVGLL